MKIFASVVLALSASVVLYAQEIQTAAAFFEQVSLRYGEIEDYSATLTITTDESVTSGRLEYRIPNQVRIDFEEPEGQILVSDGETLQVYIPQFNVVLQQPLRSRTDEALATLANEQGLNLLRQNYSIAFLDSPSPVPLETGSEESVTKLRLNWRNSTERYRQLIISIDDDLLIRRIIGVAANYQEIQFDFEDFRINEGIPDARFDYEAPSSANLFTNFLFEGEG
ncbi:MAG: outer-membrane lipoprotein carrier protein LolA [Spirochaetales bacterium]|nr:outer-membrane lipoprotein carrier protein LolA [Spirochaetales bacterium]